MAFTPLSEIKKKDSFTPFDEATSALASSQKFVDERRIFQSGLHNIAAGAGQENLDFAQGGLKRGLKEFASAGAQNAGPIGAAMTANAPGFAANLQGLQDFSTPQNTSQAVGGGQFDAANVFGAGAALVRGVKSVAGGIGSFVRSKLGTKTLEEIKATPETELPKLSKEERELFKGIQKREIDTKFDKAEAQIAKETSERLAKLAQESDDIIRQSEVASRDETLALRPKVIKAMGEQSKEYRRLVEEEIGPLRDEQVDAADMRAFIQSKFGEYPEVADDVIKRIGIPQDGVTTVGKIYDKTTELGQDIAAAAKKGTRTFTPDEMKVDKAINTLSEYLGTKGVDLKEAKQFWAQYAPVRNQMVNTIRPFDKSDLNTKGFATLLNKVAQGKDVNNENFIKALEDLVGEPVGVETKSVLAKLGANEKAQIATKIEEALQKDMLSMSKDKELMQLEENVLEAARKARIRNVTKGILVTLLGGGGAFGIYNAVNRQ